MASKKKNAVVRTGDKLRAVDKALIHSIMFELGIVPMEDPTLDMRRPLKELPPEESRILKRKFRKLWRKYMREEVGKGKQAGLREKSQKQKLGVGKHVPSRAERLERKRLVYERLWQDVIVPMLDRFENPDKDKKKE